MLHIPIKKLSSGLALPALGIGTWQLGGRTTADRTHDAEAVAALNAALDEGFTHIDTAEMYGAGHTEELVGRALAGRARDSFQVTGKVWKDHLSYDGVMRAVEGSLGRLGLDRLDLYLVHQTAPDADWDGVARAFRKLHADGVLKHLGVSNFTLARWQRFETLLELPVEANQVHYNLECREPEAAGLVDFCRTRERLLIAWRPLQKGALEMRTGVVDELTAEYHCSFAQLALNYLVSQPRVVAIAAMRNPAHRQENAGALGWSLSAADWERLRDEYPFRRPVSDAVPLS